MLKQVTPLPPAINKSFAKSGAVVEIKGISKKYSPHHPLVLGEISFSVERGKILAIVGSSGSGKTTLLNIVAGIESASSGHVKTNGSLSYMAQEDLLLPWRTVWENVVLPFEFKANYFAQGYLERARSLLQEFGLSAHTHRYPTEISVGMKQRVSLIQTLLQNTDLTIFDEPFSALDFDLRFKLGKLVRSYITSSGRSAIIVTHNIDEAIAIADHVIVLGKQPASIVYDRVVSIPESHRDPVAVRTRPEFQQLFTEIWQYMSFKSQIPHEI